MINVKVSTCAKNWPWKRQLPQQKIEWGPFVFHIDDATQACDIWFVFEALAEAETAYCPAERLVFISGEPESIGGYGKAFLKQFHYVMSCRHDISHPRILRVQQGHPWFVEKSFDELSELPPQAKTKELCVLASSKAFTQGHRDRLKFINALQSRFGERIDVYGRGIKDFDSKWDVLQPYKYSVVLENYQADDYITEKLPDAWLAYCYPFYAGAPNLGRYYQHDAWTSIDILNIENSLNVIEKTLNSAEHYSNVLPTIEKVRTYYLSNEQFFANLATVSRMLLSMPASAPTTVLLKPNIVSNDKMQKLKSLARSILKK